MIICMKVNMIINCHILIIINERSGLPCILGDHFTKSIESGFYNLVNIIRIDKLFTENGLTAKIAIVAHGVYVSSTKGCEVPTIEFHNIVNKKVH